ncbi:hypothetical protein Plo01_30000 [Planobispora longispora]|uniref:Uncharacterized protein n=1 Tax=Planobispora longispora TaxID=28887 RepID=A0A8J3RHN8_9ACTN|nr:hypothetical protein Plo01_30000 [Planobispora longispora]
MHGVAERDARGPYGRLARLAAPPPAVRSIPVHMVLVAHTLSLNGHGQADGRAVSAICQRPRSPVSSGSEKCQWASAFWRSEPTKET